MRDPINVLYLRPLIQGCISVSSGSWFSLRGRRCRLIMASGTGASKRSAARSPEFRRIDIGRRGHPATVPMGRLYTQTGVFGIGRHQFQRSVSWSFSSRFGGSTIDNSEFETSQAGFAADTPCPLMAVQICLQHSVFDLLDTLFSVTCPPKLPSV